MRWQQGWQEGVSGVRDATHRDKFTWLIVGELLNIHKRALQGITIEAT
jgi:hypothetical protein